MIRRYVGIAALVGVATASTFMGCGTSAESEFGDPGGSTAGATTAGSTAGSTGGNTTAVFGTTGSSTTGGPGVGSACASQAECAEGALFISFNTFG